jgi:hypothetical protein
VNRPNPNRIHFFMCEPSSAIGFELILIYSINRKKSI